MNAKMKKEDLFLLDELEKISDQYPHYVISLQANLFANHGLGDVVPNLKDLINKDAKKAMALLDEMERLVKNLKEGEIKLESKEWAKKTKEDYQTAFVNYVAVVKNFIARKLSENN